MNLFPRAVLFFFFFFQGTKSNAFELCKKRTELMRVDSVDFMYLS